MKIGLVGLPNVGKSTLFNAITNAGAVAANYPFCTIEPNVGISPVKDERLETLTKMYNAKNTVPAVVEFVDIAGLVKGASHGEGLGNKFLSHIREVDAILSVVRCFFGDKILSSTGVNINPAENAEIINLELILADLETVAKRMDKLKNNLKAGDKNAIAEQEVLLKLKQTLEDNKFASKTSLTPEEIKIAKSFFLLTFKPMIYVANISEDDAGKEINDIPLAKELLTFANGEYEVISISAKIEEDINALEKDEQELFLNELKIKERALDKLVNASYKLLGLISFLTAGEKEVRAWTVRKGAKAPEAAGVIHSDFEKGFIRAEVCDYNNLVKAGSLLKAKELGLVRIEGKEYIVKDGDVMLFRFNN